MKVTAIIGILLLAIAAACLVAYRIIGSGVDADGRLHEPFALIPLGWLAGISGVVLIAAGVWRGRRGR